MATKQIMIDGVDVNGCECYIPNIEMNCILHPLQSDACKNNPNCCYKQLARKEQKCEELEKKLAKVYEDIKLSPLCYKCDEEECLQKEIDKLKAENEMLRDELRFYKDFYYACN